MNVLGKKETTDKIETQFADKIKIGYVPVDAICVSMVVFSNGASYTITLMLRGV